MLWIAGGLGLAAVTQERVQDFSWCQLPGGVLGPAKALQLAASAVVPWVRMVRPGAGGGLGVRVGSGGV